MIITAEYANTKNDRNYVNGFQDTVQLIYWVTGVNQMEERRHLSKREVHRMYIIKRLLWEMTWLRYSKGRNV